MTSETERDFWRLSGWHLLEHTPAGWLKTTAPFIAQIVARPELEPDETACANERELHASLLADPLRPVSASQIAALGDADARENYRLVIAFRDFLTAADSLEAAYLDIALGRAEVALAPVFMDNLAHVILREILKGCADPLRLRAAEVFFRRQKVSTDDGHVMLADEHVVEMYAAANHLGGLGELLTQSNTPTRRVELDVLDDDNKQLYWQRSDSFDTVIDIRFTEPPLDALARVIEMWIAHFLKIDVNVQPVQRIDDDRWVWHIGLDAEANAIFNALYQGETVDDDDLERILALFTMKIADQTRVVERVRGRPVYLGLAMNGDNVLRLKPQNLLANMPLETAS